VGTDFNDGVHGIGPKKALALVRQHGRIESMPAEVREKFSGDLGALRGLYLQPDVTDVVQIEFREPDMDGIVRFLCDERQFSRERVTDALDRYAARTGG
jgi:flap endonuclease-1